jgi:hypothetical protein
MVKNPMSRLSGELTLFLIATILCGALQPAQGADFSSDSSTTKSLDLQPHGDYLYGRPGLFDFARHLPSDEGIFFKNIFRKENTLPILIVSGSTALLIWKDQALVDEARRFGSRNHISQNSDQSNRHGFTLAGQKIEVGLPTNWGEAMYFIGDGWTHLSVAGGFLATGLIKNDNRAKQTSSQIVESILTSGLVVQVLKHTTGRESPFTTNTSGGVWRFFPNQHEYSQNVAHFDAFPSGHLAAATATGTVIIMNYPEYPILKPVCVGLLGLLSFQMMNNGVHWASDYPLAIALGYSFGRISVRRGRTRKSDDQDRVSFTSQPMVLAHGLGMKGTWKF